MAPGSENLKRHSAVGNPVEGIPSEAAPRPKRQPRFTHSGGERPLDGYTIKRGIGVGGFGEVYFAISDAGKEVALKRIQRNLDIELRGVRQCLNLKHVNLISLWDIRTSDDGDSWVVMEYVPGHSLRDVLTHHRGGMEERELESWYVSICAGVNYLHDRGIVHRDLKPGNIFYDSDEQIVKIGDYGLSKFISHSGGSGHTESVGTFHYMAPEIGRGVYGKGIDVYAMGIILFEMLTGELPFDGESSQEIMMKHLIGTPPLEKVPEKFRQVIEVSLAKDPDNRYATVRELMLDLPWDSAREAASAGARSVTHVPPSSGIEPPTIARQNPAGPLNQIGDEPVSCREIDGVLYIDDPGDELPGVSLGPVTVTNRMSGSFDARRNAAPIPVSRRTSQGLSNEPVARAVSAGSAGLWGWFRDAPLATPIKLVIAGGVAMVLVINSGWLLPVAVGIGLIYLVYFAIRSFLMTGATIATGHVQPAKKGALHEHSAYLVRTSLGQQPWLDRMTDLMGSMLVSTITVLVIGLLGLAAGGDLLSAGIVAWAHYAAISVSAIAGSWMVLSACKFWEHREEDVLHRRIVMAGIGLLIGAGSFAIGEFLLQDAVVTSEEEISSLAADSRVFQRFGGNLILYTLLFGSIRWWRLGDPVRQTRLSLWGTGLCGVAAVILAGVLQRDPLSSGLIALSIAISVQVASPWVSRGDRERARSMSLAHPGHWQSHP